MTFPIASSNLCRVIGLHSSRASIHITAGLVRVSSKRSVMHSSISSSSSVSASILSSHLSVTGFRIGLFGFKHDSCHMIDLRISTGCARFGSA
jgi:hypothetical protein